MGMKIRRKRKKMQLLDFIYHVVKGLKAADLLSDPDDPLLPERDHLQERFVIAGGVTKGAPRAFLDLLKNESVKDLINVATPGHLIQAVQNYVGEYISCWGGEDVSVAYLDHLVHTLLSDARLLYLVAGALGEEGKKSRHS